MGIMWKCTHVLMHVHILTKIFDQVRLLVNIKKIKIVHFKKKQVSHSSHVFETSAN